MEDSCISQLIKLTFLRSAGELALEEHRGTGPAVDAKVCEARLVRQRLPDTSGAGRLEEALHPDCAGAAGQEIRSELD